MFKNPGIERKLFAILKADKWDLIQPFFGTWQDDDELIDKVLLWGHFFLDHYFRDASPEFHRDIIRAYFSPRNEYKAAPRGFSKTTILQTCTDFSIQAKYDKFIVVIEKTFTEAAEVIKGIHDEFVDNEKIHAAYGDLLHQSQAPTVMGKQLVKNPEARGDVFINGVRLRGKGFNTTIRGLKTRQWRPTRIICDDVEEDDHISNPEQRAKYMRNYNKGIQPAVDVDGSIKVFGTILHYDSLLQNLIDMHGGTVYRAYEPNDPANTLLWPARWPLDRLEAKKQDMGTSAFSQEYLNDPVSEEERSFKFHWLWEMIPVPGDEKSRNPRTYRVPVKRLTMAEFEKLRRTTTLNGYAMIDTADSTKENADWTAAIVKFVDPHNNHYRVDVRRERRNIKGVIDLIFDIWSKWAPYGLIKIGIEKKGFEDQILPLFDEEKRRRQVYPVIEELKPMGRNKEGRIKGALEGLYEMGKVFSVGRIGEDGKFKPVGETDELLGELYDFPAAKHDDLSDAEAYGADIIVVPLADEEKQQKHHDPVDDAYTDDQYANMGAINNFVGGHDDADPFD